MCMLPPPLAGLGGARGSPLGWLCGVGVITSALHAEGPGFKPQRSHHHLHCAFGFSGGGALNFFPGTPF